VGVLAGPLSARRDLRWLGSCLNCGDKVFQAARPPTANSSSSRIPGMQIRRSLSFVRANTARVALISALLILPCFWHKRLEAGDVPSHTYNAWLAHLIQQDKAPGLYLEPRWNNVLVDVSLQKLGGIAGFIAAERILAVMSVLIFFWGAFALISAATGRPPWVLVPAIGMITYGWTFYSGFMNFYLSIGLAFFAVALIWRGHGTDWLTAVVLAVLALLAHPLGFLCLVGLAAYFRLAELLRGWLRWLLFASAFGVVTAFHYYAVRFRNVYWHTKDFLEMNGADQLVLFSSRYEKLALAVLVLGVACFLSGVICEWKNCTSRWAFRGPLEMWTVLIFTAIMIPEVLWFPQYVSPFALIISRLTSVTAILALCVLGSVQPKSWHLVVFGICSAVFFIWTYQDTGTLNDMERQVETLTNSLPYGRRVIETINLPEGSRLWFVNHIVDRACIGHCFAYSNYEPPSLQFRIRVRHGSPVNTDSEDDSANMENGFYVVRKEDLPINQIYQCDEKNLAKLCIRELSAGEENGRIGYRPQPIQ
jgi:hypothetical protein